MHLRKLLKTVVASACVATVLLGTIPSVSESKPAYAAQTQETETTNLNLIPEFQKYEAAFKNLCVSGTSINKSHFTNQQILNTVIDLKGKDAIIALGTKEAADPENPNVDTYKVEASKIDSIALEYFYPDGTDDSFKDRLHQIGGTGVDGTLFNKITYVDGYYYLTTYTTGSTAAPTEEYYVMAYGQSDYNNKKYYVFVYVTEAVTDKATQITSSMKKDVDYIIKENGEYRIVKSKHQIDVRYDGSSINFLSHYDCKRTTAFTQQYIRRNDVIKPETRNLVIEKTDYDNKKQMGSYTALASNYGLIFLEDSGYKVVFSDGTISNYTENNCPAIKELDKIIDDFVKENPNTSPHIQLAVCDNKNHYVMWIAETYRKSNGTGTEMEFSVTLTKEDGSYVDGFDGFLDFDEAQTKVPQSEAGYGIIYEMNYVYKNNSTTLYAVNDVIGLIPNGTEREEGVPYFDLIEYKTGKVLLSNIDMWPGVYRLIGSYEKDNFYFTTDDGIYRVYYKEVVKESATETVKVDSTTNIVKCETKVGTDQKAVVAEAESGVIPADSVFRFALPEKTSSDVVSAKDAINKFIVTNKEEGKEKTSLSDNFVVWDIDLLASDSVTKIQPSNNGKVKISVPKTEGLGDNVIVYRYDGDTVTALTAKVEGDMIVFETDHFSYFVVDNAPEVINAEPGTDPGTETEVPPTGDNNALGMLFIMTLLSGMILLLSATNKKRA